MLQIAGFFQNHCQTHLCVLCSFQESPCISFSPCPVAIHTTTPSSLFFKYPAYATAPLGSTKIPLWASSFRADITSSSVIFMAKPPESRIARRAASPSIGSPHAIAVAIVRDHGQVLFHQGYSP